MFLSCVAFGPNQLAHAAGRGARDALALMVLTWLEGFEKSLKFAIYCSNASGAFDKVRRERLEDKLRAKGIHPSVIRVLSSLRAAKDCQEELHSWGRSNQIQLDPSKESMHVVARRDAQGPDFKILGVEFDCKLLMGGAVRDTATSGRWKLKTVMRTRRFFHDSELVLHYKSRILSFIEYRTPGVAGWFLGGSWDLCSRRIGPFQLYLFEEQT